MKNTIVCLLTALILAVTALACAGCGEESASEKKETTAPATTQATTAAATTQPTTAAPTTVAPTTIAPTTAAPTTEAPATEAEESEEEPEQVYYEDNGGSQNNNNNNNNKNNNQKNNNTPANNTPQQPAKQGGSFSASDADFVYNGSVIALNTDIKAALPVLGNPQKVDSQTSCHGVGDDKTYYYNGFTINTFPLNGKDYIMEIVVTSPSLATAKGVGVGSSESDVIAAYGSGYSEVGMYYSYGSGKMLQFFMDGGTVTEVDYFYDI